MSLPIPTSFDIESTEASIQWRHWKKTWEFFECTAEINEKTDKVQIATLLTILGESCRRIYDTFTFEKKEIKISDILNKFDQYIESRDNIIFERCVFQMRTQESQETLANYITEIKIMSKK